MNAEDLNAIHGNPDNWHFVFFYFAPEDPRIVVRKRLRTLGWTLNFARPMALPFLGALIAAVYGYMDLLSRADVSDSAKWVGIFLLVGLLVFLCAWMSNPRRYISADERKP
jgi:protein-S-isoprenylcysteine O-methyltransferase Ste14